MIELIKMDFYITKVKAKPSVENQIIIQDKDKETIIRSDQAVVVQIFVTFKNAFRCIQSMGMTSLH